MLARTRKLLDSAVESLKRAGLPAYIAVRKSEFTSAPYRWMHSVLRLANSRQDGELLSKVCRTFYELEGISINSKDVISNANATDSDFLRSWVAAVRQRAPLSSGAMKALDIGLPALLDRMDIWRFEKAAREWFAERAQSETGADQEAFADYIDEGKAWDYLVADISGKYGREAITLHLLLQEFDLNSKSTPAPKEAVPCYTIHGCKGMEFQEVYLIGMAEDQLPSWGALKAEKLHGNNAREIQEERRNCFVAITRAQQKLTLTFSDEIFGWRKSASRFLREMGLIDTHGNVISQYSPTSSSP